MPHSRRPLSTSLLAFAGLLAFLTACVTINVYFPEAAVKDLSQQIEKAVAQEAAKAQQDATESTDAETPEASEGSPLATLRHRAEVAIGMTLHWLAPSPVYADEDDVAAPEISNPAIRKIIETRGKRVTEIRPLKSKGVLGENNQAEIEIRNLDQLGLQERAAAQRLVKAENADRQRMFKEIAAATGTDLSQLAQIQKTYAETLRTQAKAGDWIQMPDGSWKQKG